MTCVWQENVFAAKKLDNIEVFTLDISAFVPD